MTAAGNNIYSKMFQAILFLAMVRVAIVSRNTAPISGTTLQSGTMAWMSDNIRMATHTGGGLFAGLKRAFQGHRNLVLRGDN